MFPSFENYILSEIYHMNRNCIMIRTLSFEHIWKELLNNIQWKSNIDSYLFKAVVWKATRVWKTTRHCTFF